MADNSFKTFAKRMRLVGDAIVQDAGRITRETALAIDKLVVKGTPVRTGRARANWRVALDQANAETLGAPAPPGSSFAAARAAAEARALGEAKDIIRGFDPERNQAIVISNNLPYIGRLNGGSSLQAARGFVETAVMRAAQAVKTGENLSELTVEEVGPATAAPPEEPEEPPEG